MVEETRQNFSEYPRLPPRVLEATVPLRKIICDFCYKYGTAELVLTAF